ncbi:hypothetical protein [Algoriphagus sp. AGSA1]|uniref:hypothetical protein n=1 Tax=Algoriphagus sp. AGSA1 TaxID=2907213 RepID=UPI001F3D2F68|nr:hypothetical protein [Algoriphagus sp. AGSA1]
MISQTSFSFRKLTVFSIAVLGFCLWAGNSMAQSEHEESEMEQELPSDKPFIEGSSDFHDVPNQDLTAAGSTTVAPSAKPTPQKKVPQVAGEGKKPEPNTSTLSFNIFLYIVDKFKAD